MKKLFILAFSMSLAVAVAPLSTAMAQTPAKKNVAFGPDITFTEKSHDFGNINQGDVVEYTFKFKNTGNQPLVISNVTTTCGCTVPEWPKEPIAPGKSSNITAKFNSAGKMGQQNKVITVESNAVSGTTTVALISNVQEKPAAGAAVTKPTTAPAATATAPDMKTKTNKTKTKTKN